MQSKVLKRKLTIPLQIFCLLRLDSTIWRLFMTQLADQKSFWQQLLERKVSRRKAISTAVLAGAASALPLTISSVEASNNGAPTNPVGTTINRRPPFKATPATDLDALTLPAGYRYQVLAPWGEKINDRGDQIGFNHDFIGYFPIDMLEGGSSSTEALLTINHEYVNPLFVGGETKERTKSQIEAEMKAVGISVVRVKLEASGWQIVQDARNRRIDAFTEIELTGPARGTTPVKGATKVKGSVGNCSGGQTPWGTLLTCEENVDGYAKAWAGSGYEAVHQGWVTDLRRHPAQKFHVRPWWQFVVFQVGKHESRDSVGTIKRTVDHWTRTTV